VLYPGTLVRIHGLRSQKTKHLNEQEGDVKEWNQENGRLHVAMSDGSIKAFKPSNLRKIIKQEESDPELDRVVAVFETYDTDGDGILAVEEFQALLKGIGLSGSMLQNFLVSVDKDGDGEVAYKEFAMWALGKTGTKRRQSRMDIYWPEVSKEVADTYEKADESDEDIDDDRDFTVEDVAKFCPGKQLPSDWPTHGITVFNNARNRFPDYPIEGVIYTMRQEDYVGGKVMHAIRSKGTREIELVPASAVKIGRPGDFPAVYNNRSMDGPMPVYAEAGHDWSFQNMRDKKLKPVGEIPFEGRIRVLEVRRGNEYGFCFGRIEFEGRKTPQHWVVLGLEMNRPKSKIGVRSMKNDSEITVQDLEYTDATRV